MRTPLVNLNGFVNKRYAGYKVYETHYDSADAKAAARKFNERFSTETFFAAPVRRGENWVVLNKKSY